MNNDMKNGKTLTLNDKGILLIGIIILSLTFALGFMVSSKRRDDKTVIFTKEDLERIVELQELEEEKKSKADIFAYKDKDGNLVIGWDSKE